MGRPTKVEGDPVVANENRFRHSFKNIQLTDITDSQLLNLTELIHDLNTAAILYAKMIWDLQLEIDQLQPLDDNCVSIDNLSKLFDNIYNIYNCYPNIPEIIKPVINSKNKSLTVDLAIFPANVIRSIIRSQVNPRFHIPRN